MYNQDRINQAHQICQNYIKEKGFDRMDMIDRLLLTNIPEDLANEVVANYEVDKKALRKARGIKYLMFGALIFCAIILISVVIYLFTGHIYIIISGLMIVPMLSFIVAGLWEILE